MRHVGYIETLFQEGDALYCSVRLTQPLPWKEFQVRGHLGLNGMTWPDQGHYRLDDLVLGPCTQESRFPEWNIQTDVNKIGLLKIAPFTRRHDLDCIERQVAKANLDGINFSVRIVEGDEPCCEEHS